MFEKRDREVHKMDYKNEIIKLINKLNASDETFLKQVYIIIKKHFDRREGRLVPFSFLPNCQPVSQPLP